MKTVLRFCTIIVACVFVALSASGQIGRRFPSEKKIIPDPVTGVPLTFLTSTPAGDSKIYQTHPQWTADGKWVIFRSARVPGQVMAVNEASGAIVQVTEQGYMGMLCVAQHSMTLYLMRDAGPLSANAAAATADGTGKKGEGMNRPRGPFQIVAVDLAGIFADSERGSMKPAASYERVCGTTPPEMRAGGDMALDANEDFAYFRFTGGDLARRLPADTPIAAAYGPRGMGAGPAGLASLNLKTGETKFIVAVPFQIGHVQTNPFLPGEIVFCWETGGKAPQRTWLVQSDGTGLRPLYPEATDEWVTHEAVVTRDEVVLAVMGHRKPGTSDPWGIAGTREHPTGLGVVNLRTREMRMIAQTPSGSGLWHVHGSADGRWAVGDDFSRSIYLIDRHSGEMLLLSTGHKATAADHPHPSFNADGTKIHIESALLSADDRAMNICIIPVPEAWLKRPRAPRVSP